MGPGSEIPTFKEHSSFHVLKSVNNIDYSVPSPADATAGSPIGWSHSNALVFGRGNRVYYKSMADTERVAQQLCKITDTMGNLALVQCAGEKHPNTAMLATSNGHMQLWDLVTKRPTLQWRMKGPSAMIFNATLLTVGDEKGALRHYDTRVNDPAKMKDQATKVTRHQGRITSLAWNRDGFTVASGDQNGLILVWDIRKPRLPLEVGELVQRRRKMQHVGAITVRGIVPFIATVEHAAHVDVMAGRRSRGARGTASTSSPGTLRPTRQARSASGTSPTTTGAGRRARPTGRRSSSSTRRSRPSTSRRTSTSS